jgi:hypothetical protein
MLTKLVTCQTLLPMLAALFAQWALSTMLSGGTFVQVLHGWNISTLFSLGWLEVSIVCYSNLAGLTFINVFSLGWPHLYNKHFGNSKCRN